MPSLPPIHTPLTEPKTIISTNLPQRQNLQQLRPRVSRICDSIDDLLVCLRNPWTLGVTRGAVRLGTGAGTL